MLLQRHYLANSLELAPDGPGSVGGWLEILYFFRFDSPTVVLYLAGTETLGGWFLGLGNHRSFF